MKVVFFGKFKASIIKIYQQFTPESAKYSSSSFLCLVSFFSKGCFGLITMQVTPKTVFMRVVKSSSDQTLALYFHFCQSSCFAKTQNIYIPMNQIL